MRDVHLGTSCPAAGHEYSSLVSRNQMGQRGGGGHRLDSRHGAIERALVAACTLTGRGPPERRWRSAYHVRRASACWNESSGRGQTWRAMCTSTSKSENYGEG